MNIETERNERLNVGINVELYSYRKLINSTVVEKENLYLEIHLKGWINMATLTIVSKRCQLAILTRKHEHNIMVLHNPVFFA